jgi:hypothetical protein
MLYWRSMNLFRPSRSRRLVASLLIALTCLCIGIEDLFASETCGEDAVLSFGELRALTVAAAEDPQQPSPANSGDDDHDCLCCCRHVVASGFFQPSRALNFSFITLIPGDVGSSVDPQPPYHPPRA